jgi:hypothetical protein
MGEDVHLRRLARIAGADGGQLPDEVNQPHQRVAVDAEGPVVQIVVAEHPERSIRVPGPRRVADDPRHGRVDDDFVERADRLRRVRRLREEVVRKVAEIGRARRIDDRRRKVADDVGGVLILPRRLHELQNHAFVDVVVAALVRIHGSVVEALVGDALLVLDAQAAETSNENQGQRPTARGRPLRHGTSRGVWQA